MRAAGIEAFSQKNPWGSRKHETCPSFPCRICLVRCVKWSKMSAGILLDLFCVLFCRLSHLNTWLMEREAPAARQTLCKPLPNHFEVSGRLRAICSHTITVFGDGRLQRGWLVRLLWTLRVLRVFFWIFTKKWHFYNEANPDHRIQLKLVRSSLEM